MSKAASKRDATTLRNALLKQLLDKEITKEEAARKIGAINRAEQRREPLPDENA